MSLKAIGLTLLLMVSAVGIATPSAAAANSTVTTIDGADNRDDAPVLQQGDKYHPTGGWYKVYIDESGARVSANLTDITTDEDNPYDNRNYQVNNGGEEFKINDGGYGYNYYNSAIYEYIAKDSGYTYIYLPPSETNNDDDRYTVLTVTTESPDTDVYDVESVTTTPQEVKPGEETTLQARIQYDQNGLLNRERGDVEISVDGEVVHTEQISLDQGDAASVSAVYNISTTGDTSDRTVTVRAAPNWTSISEGTQAEATLSIDANDLDNDGLQDSREDELGTDPRDADSDDDGLDDGRELELGTDPMVSDTDGDNLSDKKEIDGKTDPLVADSDGDGLADGREVALGTDPMVTDTDGDGLSDYKEVEELSTDPTSVDTDNDDLNDSEEFEKGTDPTQADTDNDGLPDARELEIGSNPEAVDTDGDGISDYEEYRQGTDPTSETDSAENQVRNESQVVEDRSLVVDSETVSLQLRSERTIVEQGQPAVLVFSSAALINARDTVTVQLILEVPSGVSVSGTAFTESGTGQYTTTFELEPGDTKGQRVILNANEQGRFGVTGRAVYFVGDERENASREQVTIPVRVVGRTASQPDASPVSDGDGGAGGLVSGSGPGFTVSGTLVALVSAGYLLRRRSTLN